MGCFLGCFGFTKKRKRPKFSNKIVSPNQRHGRYVALDSDNDISDSELDIIQKTSDYEHIDKHKEPASLKIKKKVRFNLDVKSYEPIQNDETDTYFSEGEEETKWEFNEEETQRATTMFDIHREQDTMLSKNLSYLADYRYQNCTDGYDDEDEIVLDDFDDDDDDDDDEDEVYDNDSNEEEEEDQTINNVMLHQALPDEELNGIESNHNVRYRSQYVCSVLNPIENLSHWKAVKARAKLQLKQVEENELSSRSKKNSYHVLRNDKLMENENPVDSSLSNWVFSSDKEPVSKI